ncbi:Imm1 family immunity protein [Pseudoduganella violaceinigra]|uniref:Imm1 family immunity protein n=1 Tax=Pseudoduganella violaceinigra TaxID=246602 RepID=UPI000A00ADE8|nr:Imm1 family immunity protein [Pseudoduganella violaceinigra]
MMKIVDGNGTAFSAISDVEIEAVFASRYENNANEFWISNDGDEFPYLVVLVKDDISCLQYFSDEDHAGFNSKGNESEDGYSLFYINVTEEQDISNDMVVPVSKALIACKEFLATRTLPQAIEWTAVAE